VTGPTPPRKTERAAATVPKFKQATEESKQLKQASISQHRENIMRALLAAISATRIPPSVLALPFALVILAFSLATVATIQASAVPALEKDQSRVAVSTSNYEMKIRHLEGRIAELERLVPGKQASLGPVGREEPYTVASLPPGDRITIPTPFGVDMDLHVRGKISTACLPGPLKTVLAKVQRECSGFRVISANRPGARVRGSGNTSLHASCRAADIQVSNPSCARKVLANWPGGLSTDYQAVNHFHLSYAKNSREWGKRFAHWKPGKTRYAKRHRTRA
jgi:hypothetical protein